MYGQTDYHGIIKKYIEGFAYQFTNVVIQRVDQHAVNPTAPVQNFMVPLRYAAKNRFLDRLLEFPNTKTPKAGVVLPAISYDDISMNPDPTQNVNQLQEIVNNETGLMVMPYTPFTFGFQLGPLRQVPVRYVPNAGKDTPQFPNRPKHPNNPRRFHARRNDAQHPTGA